MSADDKTPAFTGLPDLASEGYGGAAIACNDEFFAEKENLVRATEAVWKEHEYTDRGKWMDGWETRRRREPGHDWCIVRLGMPGIIRGVVVDTAFFRGNFPESCALYAYELDDPLDLRALDDPGKSPTGGAATWTNILPRTQLRGDAKNVFTIGYEQRFTHVRIDIFPDGGVARLRVHGDVAPRLDRLRGERIDLAALENGAYVETCSDMFFGSRNNLIKPGPSRSMADGWETRRRRGPGNDWAIIRLAAPGVIDELEIDTTHFKGNAPGSCIVDGVHAPGVRVDALQGWRTLLASPLQPHRKHVFADELRRIGKLSHLRLSVFPDGGVARLRARGRLADAPHAGLEKLATMSGAEATEALKRCCGSSQWTAAMVAARPFEDVAALLRIAERTWWHLAEADHLEAFAAHPKIGESGGGAWSAQEQAGATHSAADTSARLAEKNREYAGKHGFIFIVCASGRSAESMLADLEQRLRSSRAEEVRTAAEEQAKITRLRLQRLIEELS
jgi:allantoicase